MGALFDFLFSNPIFGFLLIMGIISFFNRQAKGRDQQQSAETTANHQQPTYESRNRRESARRSNTHEPTETESLTFDEQRKQQMEQFGGRMNTSLDADEEIDNAAKKTRDIVQTSNKKAKKSNEQSLMQHRVQKRLTKDGLIDSIVMAEVLGRPRALEPYSNVLTRKKSK